jgi:hypothetical protein
MGKFLEGWERARMAAEAREAEKQRRLEQVAAALTKLSDLLQEDSDQLTRRQITMRVEHGALVLKRMLQPMAGVTFDPDTGRFKIHEYTQSEGASELEAENVDECATKLGEFAYSLEA